MQQHAGLRLQPKSIVSADDALEVVRTQSLENDPGIFNRLIGRHGLSFPREMFQSLFHTRIEPRPVQAMGEIMSSEHPQRVLEADMTRFTYRKTKQFLHSIADKTEDLFEVPLRQTQLGECQVDRIRDIPLRFDEGAIQIEDQQLDRSFSHEILYLAFRSSSCSTARLSRLAGSVSLTQASRTKLIIRF